MEVNCDVPGGFIEASGFTELIAHYYPEAQAPPNPAKIYASAIHQACPEGGVVAMVFATAYSDDYQVMRCLSDEFCALGLKTHLVSPAHIAWNNNRARFACRFADGSADALVRFFPAEWLPNLGGVSSWRNYFCDSEIPVSNPACSLLIQTKRFPLTRAELDSPLPTWKERLPESVCPSEGRNLDFGGWVLKPALGRVGEGIAIQGMTNSRLWTETEKAARRRPRDWVIQRRFDIVPIQIEGKLRYLCFGVFTINGRTAGIYGRIADTGLVDGSAQDIAVLIAS